MPYADKRYNLKEYNPPPNEVGFLGGLGKKTGTSRSKAHIQRPNANQILFKMKTANRILVSFTEDLGMTHSLTRKQLKLSPKPKRKSTGKEDLGLLVSQVQIADNILKRSKKKQVSSTTSETEVIKHDEVKLEPIILGNKKKSPRISLGGTMKKISMMSALKSERPLAPSEPATFREWALAEREKRFQALQQVSYQQIKQEREANEIFPRVKKQPKKFFVANKKKDQQQQQLPGAEHLGGYLYGGLSTKDTKLIDATMEKQTKFHVPLTMFCRAEVESKVRAICRKKIQSARLDYMRIPQIPSDSEDDDSDDILEDSKGLGLIRTPYFRIPTIFTSRKRRIERLKNKHLKGNRLKRINMLLFDRKMSAEKNKQKYAFDEGCISPTLLKKGIRDTSIESSIQVKSKESSPLPDVEDIKITKTFENSYR